MDSGFVFTNDTLPLNDTVRVGVVIVAGDDPLRTFQVLTAYDGGPEGLADSLTIPTGSFSFEKSIVTRNLVGMERWIFWVQERDGDITRRALTFTVQ
ncbi:MAG: hypothetical protein JNM62_01585 [Flavobacteriales bacterium]|nr:hypothetical protein [Flavobacteriales bacterium]